MVNRIEEFGQIQFHNPRSPFGDVFLGLLNGLVSTLSRAESITELRKQRIKVLCQDLCYGLLNDPVLHRRDAQLACASVRFGNIDAFDCGGNVFPLADVRYPFVCLRALLIDN